MKRWIVLLLMTLAASAGATTFAPQQWATVTLADGSTLEIRTLNPVASAEGTALVLAETRDGDVVTEVAGHWFYAARSADGSWHPHTAVAGEGDVSVAPVQITSLNISAAAVSGNAPQRTPFRYDPAQGSFQQPLLVVRVAFANQDFLYSDADVAHLFFNAENSVQAYYREDSYGRFNIVPAEESSGIANDGVVQITLAGNHPDFGNGYSGNSQSLAKDVMTALAGQLDLSGYDRNQDGWLDPNELALVIMVAGYEQAYAGAATTHPRIWAHKATVYQASLAGEYIAEYAMFGEQHQDHLATIGILCHELGHLLFDLPDLYDTSGAGMGIGRWGLMGLGGWNREAGFAGERPAHMLAWSKQSAGFLQPQALVAGINDVKLQAVSDAADAVEVSLDEYRHGERLMLEHRRQSGFDAGLPGSGVLVTRINDRAGFGSLSMSSAGEQLLFIEEADGRQDLQDNRNLGEASDLFSSASGELLFSAQAGAVGGNSVQLLTVENGLVADLSLELASAPDGDNIGLDELPPNAVYGAYNGSATVQMTLNTGNATFADGVDFYALGDGYVVVSLVDASGSERMTAAAFSVTEGWNRLLWNAPVALVADSALTVVIQAQAYGNYAPFAIDAQGGASGLTMSEEDGVMTAVPFDLSARLLVQRPASVSPSDVDKNVDQPIDPAPAADSGSASASASGGGLFHPLWLLLLLVVRRKVAV